MHQDVAALSSSFSVFRLFSAFWAPKAINLLWDDDRRLLLGIDSLHIAGTRKAF